MYGSAPSLKKQSQRFLSLFLGCIYLLFMPSHVFSQQPNKQSFLAHQLLYKKRLKIPHSRSKQQFSAKRHQLWKSYLQSLQPFLKTLNKKQLSKLRRFLENYSDRDRNRFHSFPDALTMKIIRFILKVDRQKARRSNGQGSGPTLDPNDPTHRRQVAIRPKKVIPPSHRAVAYHSNQPMLGEGHLPDLEIENPQPLPSNKSRGDSQKTYTNKYLRKFKKAIRFLRWPVPGARLTSGFGWRKDPFHRRHRFHNGIDWAAKRGTIVIASANGVVVKSGWMGGCGLGVLLRFNHQFSAYHCHLAGVLVNKGQRVGAGQAIGQVGSTGRSTGPHLHFSLLRNGKATNPRPFLMRR